MHLSQRENATSDEGDEDRDDDDRDSDTPSVYSSNVDLDNASEMWRSLKKSERNMWRKRAREYSVDPDNWHQYRAMLSIKRYANAHRNEAILEDLKSMSLQELEALQVGSLHIEYLSATCAQARATRRPSLATLINVSAVGDGPAILAA